MTKQEQDQKNIEVLEELVLDSWEMGHSFRVAELQLELDESISKYVRDYNDLPHSYVVSCGNSISSWLAPRVEIRTRSSPMSYKLRTVNGIVQVYDDNGNCNSVEKFGSVQDAARALTSLLDCTNCIDCSNCRLSKDSSNCTNCSRVCRCSNCVESIDCFDCNNCSQCHDCDDCSNCIGLDACVNCSGCNNCTCCNGEIDQSNLDHSLL